PPRLNLEDYRPGLDAYDPIPAKPSELRPWTPPIAAGPDSEPAPSMLPVIGHPPDPASAGPAAAIDPRFEETTDVESGAIARRFAPARSDAGHAVSDRPYPPRHVGTESAHQGHGYRRPSLNELKKPVLHRPDAATAEQALRGQARLLLDALADFSVKGEIKDIRPGPVVTVFELEPARGTKASRVIGLADDIARAMSVASVRIAVVPGRSVIGIEMPNARREAVAMREILESREWRESPATLPIALGKSIAGDPVVMDLARMPHLLVAGTTGSGKSVGVNSMILSLLYRHGPEACRFLMIDPKMLELSVYNGIPHLLTPVVTDPSKAAAALGWVVREMEERYKRMASLAVRNLEMYNARVRNAAKAGEPLSRQVQTGYDPQTGEPVYETETIEHAVMTHIVVVVDEFADLMMVAGKDVEAAVQRLAQMARAAGIHLIMATQRPSVDVITGTIKANFPTRISFKVASKIDSRTILNEMGAEALLGMGDMLVSSGGSGALRVHGAFVADEEVERIAAYLREQGTPDYVLGITEGPEDAPESGDDRGTAAVRAGGDDLYQRAVALVLADQKASTSYVQRRLGIGYNRAADLIERMEREGLIGPVGVGGKRAILGPSHQTPTGRAA
ncbi:MAG TPA: DNA translocase FtsK, partial [Hyphomicrobiaceae bacterium]|nr:DNA translocase FtsK [Hyphomicrobiaceae bacterium]